MNTAERRTRTAVFTVNAAPDEAFPLFGPVKEQLWADGWEPCVVFPAGCEIELHMVFTTKPDNAVEEVFTWSVTRYEPADLLVEYTVSTPNRVWFITVQCSPAGDDRTDVRVTYSYTALNATGDALNAAALERMFHRDLRDWEVAVNHYLETGTLLREEVL